MARITTPTLLTLLRIGLIPVFVLFFFLPVSWSHIAATAIFSLAAITDWFDGYLARKLSFQFAHEFEKLIHLVFVK